MKTLIDLIFVTLTLAVFLFGLLAMGAMVSEQMHNRIECEAAGGALVRGSYGPVCVPAVIPLPTYK